MEQPHVVRKLDPYSGRSLVNFHARSRFYKFMWHFHHEYEILAVLSGRGKWLIGDRSGEWAPGEVFLLGPGLPHSFYGMGDPARAGDELDCRVVMFSPAAVLTGKGTAPELSDLAPLLARAANGLHYRGSAGAEITSRLQVLDALEGLPALVVLLDVLANMAARPAPPPLASAAFISAPQPEKILRIDAVYHYLHEHCVEAIKLADVARHVHTSVPNLCGLFKRATGQTVMSYVQELRITRACELLAQTDESITRIALRVGYSTLSSFNRQFKFRRGISPRNFRHQNAGAR